MKVLARLVAALSFRASASVIQRSRPILGADPIWRRKGKENAVPTLSMRVTIGWSIDRAAAMVSRS